MELASWISTAQERQNGQNLLRGSKRNKLNLNAGEKAELKPKVLQSVIFINYFVCDKCNYNLN